MADQCKGKEVAERGDRANKKDETGNAEPNLPSVEWYEEADRLEREAGRVLAVPEGLAHLFDHRGKATVYESAKHALCRALFQSHGLEAMGKWGKPYESYAASIEANLLDTVPFADIRQAFDDGKGQELLGDALYPPKMAAVHSSSALVVNTFGPWHPDISQLVVNGHGGFKTMAFEAQVPHGLRGTSPHLDLRLDAADRILAIESKCLEYLTPKRAVFAPAYDSIADHRAQSPWYRHIADLRHNSQQYRYLDAAQLIKHYLGLSHGEPSRSITLLYLFWEPRNWHEFEVCRQHRAEIHTFSQVVAGDRVRFEACSYADLWNGWAQQPMPDWLPGHVGRLRARYLVDIMLLSANEYAATGVQVRRWSEGVVDRGKEHMKLFVGPFGDEAQLIALAAPTGDGSFEVQFVVDKQAYEEAVTEVTRELNFYLIEKGEDNPWAYAKYHCSTASNIYSSVHWAWYPSTT